MPAPWPGPGGWGLGRSVGIRGGRWDGVGERELGLGNQAALKFRANLLLTEGMTLLNLLTPFVPHFNTPRGCCSLEKAVVTVDES